MTDNTKSKPAVQAEIVGTNRGALAMVPYLSKFNRDSDTELQIRGVDLVPGRAAQRAEELTALGVPSEGVQSTAQAFFNDHVPRGPVIVQLDQPNGHLAAAAAARAAGVPVHHYLVIITANQLWGLMASISPDHHRAHMALGWLLTALASVAARSSGAAALGERAPSTVQEQEAELRRKFGWHLGQTLPRAINGAEPELAPLMVGRGSTPPVPLLVLPPAESWRDPRQLAATIDAEFDEPMVRGTEFVTAEISRQGIRLHETSLRRDGQFALGHVPLRAPDSASERFQVAQQLAAERALTRSTTLGEWTRRGAVLTSD